MMLGSHEIYLLICLLRRQSDVHNIRPRDVLFAAGQPQAGMYRARVSLLEDDGSSCFRGPLVRPLIVWFQRKLPASEIRIQINCATEEAPFSRRRVVNSIPMSTKIVAWIVFTEAP